MREFSALAALLAAALTACTPTGEVRTVTAATYAATDGSGLHQGAWGDQLHPGLKAVAVSEELISRGLGHRSEVRVEGLPGSYTVLDRLGPEAKVDLSVYVGVETRASRAWGPRRVRIYWEADEPLPD
ncbi:MAG: hypothetical protein J4G09_00890 [Proteobacteria bacterium]|nr:hypothetical protein [Pseudomonadota bacterium]